MEKFKTFTIDELKSMEVDKLALAEKIGIDEYTFDYALPQNWLNAFVEKYNLDYSIVQSTTFYAYDNENRFGYPVSGCKEVQKLIELEYQ